MKKFIKLLKRFYYFGCFKIPENRICDEHILELKPLEVFVFGSNTLGQHCGGAARYAKTHFGAVEDVPFGMRGKSYAIPTINYSFESPALSPKQISWYVDRFIEDATQKHMYNFLVTPIGCGIAGNHPTDIAPLFKKAIRVDNIALPKIFWEVLL